MKLRDGILEVGGVRLSTGLTLSDNDAIRSHMLDALEAILIVARGVHAKLWSRLETRELLRTAYRDLRNQGNLFSHLLWELGLRAGDLAPHWWLYLEKLDHDIPGTDDEIPWDDEDGEEATAPPTTEEIREKISDLLITPRKDVLSESVSRHIIDNQEPGAWVAQRPCLTGIYADSLDGQLVIGLPHRELSEFSWWESLYGSLDEDELEVLCEFLSLMLRISRHWGPLPVRPNDDIDQMALIALRDLAERWDEGPVGALAEDYLRGGVIQKAASHVARLPHRST